MPIFEFMRNISILSLCFFWKLQVTAAFLFNHNHLLGNPMNPIEFYTYISTPKCRIRCSVKREPKKNCGPPITKAKLSRPVDHHLTAGHSHLPRRSSAFYAHHLLHPTSASSPAIAFSHLRTPRLPHLSSSHSLILNLCTPLSIRHANPQRHLSCKAQ